MKSEIIVISIHICWNLEDEIFKEIDKTEQLSREIIKIDNNRFRFPYGESDERLLQLIKNKGFISIKWTIDNMDWKGISAEEISENILKSSIENGAIILMHNSGEHTVEALDLIIPTLLEKEYKMISVSDLLSTVPQYKFKLKKTKSNNL